MNHGGCYLNRDKRRRMVHLTCMREMSHLILAYLSDTISKHTKRKSECKTPPCKQLIAEKGFFHLNES